jgi:uncharacterized protein (DUF305 family)
MRKFPALAAVAVAAALALAGCAGTDRSPQDAAQSFNDADVAFGQDMIPHHRQAIEMAKLASDRAASTEVESLAAEIEKAQEPEIQTMTSWLEAWGEEVLEDMSGMGHGGMDMPGMMSAEDMMALEQASGADFDRMFLEMMIKHHAGAIDMARTEQANGQNRDAKDLAVKIEKGQSAEITTMRGLLETL